MSSGSTVEEYYPAGNIKTVWDYGTDPWTAYEYDEGGAIVNSRPFTDQEKVVAQQRLDLDSATNLRAALLAQLMSGVSDIQGAIDAANGDITVAEGLKTQADGIKSAATSQRTQIAGWNPSATYKASDLSAIKIQLDALAARDEIFAQAFSDGFVYRRNVDNFMVKAYNAILWLARVASGRLKG